MQRVVHVITTDNFAGAERYVCDVATETARRGWEVSVVGGNQARMRNALSADIQWLPGGSVNQGLRSLVKVGRQEMCHAHMTLAEAVSLTTRPVHHAPVVSTRHFAAPRGSSPAGRLLARPIARGLSRQIAISQFVARHLERWPDAVITNGVALSPLLWRRENRTVLVLQRLEREKDTLTALRAWSSARLVDEGWTMRIVGEGSERGSLEAWSASAGVVGVEFAGWTADVSQEFAQAGLLLATAPAEPFGLAVVEAMAAGVPVVASRSGGHLETVGLLPNAAVFPAGDSEAASAALQSLVPDDPREALAEAGRELVESEFTIARHVDALLAEYEATATTSVARSCRPRLRAAPLPDETRAAAAEHGDRPSDAFRNLIVCSLEPWNDVWRRNQFFVDALLRRNPKLRVLFVEPPADVLFDLSSKRVPTLPRLRRISDDGRLVAFRPLKAFPRRWGGCSDAFALQQVRAVARVLRMLRPTLWINDVTYAPLIADTHWPTVYDVTDDWLLAPFPPKEIARLRRLDELLLARADEVVVCSQALVTSRGVAREVTLVPNGVDVDHFRRVRARPSDLPASPTAVYVGSLHEARIDVDLILELAAALPWLTVVLVGPNSFEDSTREALEQTGNVKMLGQRPYEDVPAYLQHADVIVVPHRVSPFTESLDPIKAYECLALDTPTVATPVAGFREHDGTLSVVERDQFVASVETTVGYGKENRLIREAPNDSADLVSWDQRVVAFELLLSRAARRR